MYTPTRSSFPDDASDLESGRVAQHADYIQSAIASGLIMLAGRTLDASPFGMIVLRTRGFDEAKAFVDNDPAVSYKLFTADLKPFRLSMMHSVLLEQRENEATRERNRALGF